MKLIYILWLLPILIVVVSWGIGRFKSRLQDFFPKIVIDNARGVDVLATILFSVTVCAVIAWCMTRFPL